MPTARCRPGWSTSCASSTASWRYAICRSMSEEIKKLREEIGRVDDKPVESLNRRAELAKKVGTLKGGGGAYRPERETEILRRVSRLSTILSSERMTAVFREIISACRGLEEAIGVSYLGPEGTFSEQAVRKHFGRAVEAVAAASVDDAVRRCESGAVQFTVVAGQNSTPRAGRRTLRPLL